MGHIWVIYGSYMGHIVPPMNQASTESFPFHPPDFSGHPGHRYPMMFPDNSYDIPIITHQLMVKPPNSDFFHGKTRRKSTWRVTRCCSSCRLRLAGSERLTTINGRIPNSWMVYLWPMAKETSKCCYYFFFFFMGLSI